MGHSGVFSWMERKHGVFSSNWLERKVEGKVEFYKKQNFNFFLPLFSSIQISNFSFLPFFPPSQMSH